MKELTNKQAQDVYAHFAQSAQENVEIVDYATDVVLKNSRYIFVTNNALKMRKGYCTHCHARFHVEAEVKQDMSAVCPKCGSVCKYKKAWLGRKYMEDREQFLWFEKSATDPNVVIASRVSCSRKYNESYENVKTTCIRTAFCLFKIGGIESYEVWNWRDNKLVRVMKPPSGVNIDKAITSLKNAVENTPFQYSGWEVYASYRWVDYLALYCTAPNLEVLSKNGFHELVVRKILGKPTYGAINWEARKLHEFFKLPKHEFNKMKNSDAAGTYVMYAPNFNFGLWVWQKALREKSHMSYKELMAGCNVFVLAQHYKNFVKVKKYTTMHRLFNYMKKQFEEDSKHYMQPAQVLITWADHIGDCELLDMDLSSDVVLFPKNLREAHQHVHQLVTINKDGRADLKIKKRNKKLDDLTFSYGSLIIRPPETFDEIVSEGKKLEHCVGRYASDHSTGAKTIMLIREIGAPDTPFYTVELSGGRVVQVRGHKNKAPTVQVKRFMEKFEKFLKEPKHKNKKARKTA